MKRIVMIAVLLASAPANAADYMVVVNDQEKQALVEILDEATRAKGLAIAPNTVHFLNKIRSAPVVTERKDDPPKPVAPKPAESPKPVEGEPQP